MGGEISKDKNPVESKKTNEKTDKASVSKRSLNSNSGKSPNAEDNKSKRKKEKIQIVAKNKTSHNNNPEKKVLELIHKNNPKKEDYDLIYNTIDKHFFMSTLNKQARNEIIITMSLCKVAAGATLFNQGDPGNYWYIVHDGTLSFIVDGELRKELKRGDCFGEMALINESPRIATVKAVTECQLWTLKREVFRKILDFLFQLNYDENMRFLEGISLTLDNNLKSLLANNLIQQQYPAGEVIFKQGEVGNSMFIIKDGIISCMKNGKLIRELKKGDNFGQKAILEETKRSLDIVAKTDCKLYSISAEFFKNQFGSRYKDVLYFSFIQMAFNTNKFFNGVYTKMLEKVYPFFTFKSYGFNEVIFKKGEEISKKLCICLEGSIYNKGINKIEAKRYEFLFAEDMYKNKKIILKQDLIAEPDCVLCYIDYETFQEKLGGSIQSIQKKSKQLHNFDQIVLFRNLSEDKLELIESSLKLEKFDNGRKIITQGEIGDKFYIIKSGRVDFFINSKYVRSLNENEEFGERSLIIQERRSATAIANGTVTVYTLTASVFKSLLEPNLLAYFQKKFYLEDYTIELKDLENIKELGSGNFGFVNLVKSRKNKQLYAIKALNTYQIKKEKLEKQVELEKNILLKVDHPFIMKMVKYLKNDNFIFYIMEYIKGKELWEVIRDIGLLNKDQTQFYSGSMLLAIEYLHKKKIIYRDIKPENIMVNDMGYIKVIDFGTVKEIKERTSTIIGTPHYMAPEIVKGAGYSFQVDIWSIAVCMYEFFCGKLPFGEDYDDPMDVYKAVAKEDLTFPPFVHDHEFINLLTKMLKKNPTSRLWKVQQIKEEPYFKNFNWNKLISLSIPPPYKIKFKKEKEVISTNYLAYLKDHDVKQYTKKKLSARQIEFEKWLKNF